MSVRDLVRSVPATRKVPRSNSMSLTEASSRCAAIFFALSTILSMALTMALPPTAREREP